MDGGMKNTKAEDASSKVGWRVEEWARAVGLSRAFVYEILFNELDSVKVGSARIILTPPSEYLARHQPKTAA